MTMFDYMKFVNPIKIPEVAPALKTGDVVYQLTICEIEKYIIERSFSVGTAIRYMGKHDAFGGGYNSFGDCDLDEYIFLDLEGVKRQAEKNKLDHDIVFANDMEIEQQQSFLVAHHNWFLEGKPNVFGETIAIINKTMVYVSKHMLYDFMYKFETEKQTQKFYDEQLRKLNTTVKSSVHLELKNMYWCGDKYSEAKYYKNSRGVSYYKVIEEDED